MDSTGEKISFTNKVDKNSEGTTSGDHRSCESIWESVRCVPHKEWSDTG